MDPKMKHKHKQYYSDRAKAAACKRHPKHRQSAGVCSICLNEKLSKLTNHNNKKVFSKVVANYYSRSSSSDLSTLSSSNESSYSSPVKNNRAEFYEAGESKRVFKNIEVLKKSRSMAFFFQRRKDDEDENYEKKVEMKRGFWSKLFVFPRRNAKLTRSKTMRETVITTAY
ncbi:hypothetical protein ACP275_11G096300 [Erythranthe tilingii]